MDIKPYLRSHLAKLKAEIKFSSAVMSLARRGSAAANRKYNVLDKKDEEQPSHVKKKLLELGRQWYIWREHGQDEGAQRHRLLAYGYLRGLTYKQIESACAPDNKPDPSKIAMNAYYYGGPTRGHVKDHIKLWLTEGGTQRQIEESAEYLSDLSQARRHLKRAQSLKESAEKNASVKHDAWKKETEKFQRCCEDVKNAQRALAEAEVNFLKKSKEIMS